jgi:hypothetical protein
MSDEIPLSAQQEAFLAWMDGPDGLRHPAPVTVALRITDELDPDLLGGTLAHVVARHEALRTVFRGAGHRRPVVLDARPPEIRRVAAAGEDSEERLAHARALALAERDRPFDLAEGPLLRATVIRLADRDQVLLLAVHHLVFDAWSTGPLLRDLGFAYSSLRAGRPVRSDTVLPASEVVRRSRERWPGNRAAWDEALAGAPAALEIFPGREPADEVRPHSHDFTIGREAAAGIARVARAASATPFAVLLAAWSAVLSSWSGATDIVLLSPVAARTLPGSETAIGCLFSSLLIRVDLAGQPEFGELLRRTRTAILDAHARQDYPYAEYAARFPCAPCLGYYSWHVPPHFPGLDSTAFDLPPRLVEDLDTPGSGLSTPQLCVFEQQGEPMSARLDFNVAAFDEATIEDLAEDLTAFVSDLSAHTIEASDV